MIIKEWNKLFYYNYLIVYYYRVLIVVYLNPFIWIKNYKIIKYSCNSFKRLRQIMEDDYKMNRIIPIVISLTKIITILQVYWIIWVILNLSFGKFQFYNNIGIIVKILFFGMFSIIINHLVIFKKNKYEEYFNIFKNNKNLAQFTLYFLFGILVFVGWGCSFSLTE